jgi:hypothetical protein
MEGSESVSRFVHIIADPRGSKTYGSNGSKSGTLVARLADIASVSSVGTTQYTLERVGKLK